MMMITKRAAQSLPGVRACGRYIENKGESVSEHSLSLSGGGGMVCAIANIHAAICAWIRGVEEGGGLV